VNEPKKKEEPGKAATQSAKPSEPGQPVKQGQTAQAQLQQEEQSIMAYRDKAAQDLAKEDGKKTEDVLNNIQAFLKEFNAGDKYDMVIGYSKGGGVLYAKEDLDITKSVLVGLNKKYTEDKKSGKVKADTTASK
jgi:outer membrane protein